MQIRIKLRTVIIIVSLLIFAGLMLKTSIDRKHQLEVDKLNTELYAQGLETERYKIQVGDLTENVFEANTLIISKDSEILRLKDEKERLRALNIKNVDVIGKLKARIEVLIDSVPPSDTITIIEQPDGNYAKLPLDYYYSDYWADMHTTVNDNGLADMDFSITNLDLNIIIGAKGQGFLKKDKPVSSITTDNPYLTIDESTIAVVQNNVSPITYVAVGTGLGIGGMILVKSIINFFVE